MCKTDQTLKNLQLQTTRYMDAMTNVAECLVMIGQSSHDLEAHLSDELLIAVHTITQLTKDMIPHVVKSLDEANS